MAENLDQCIQLAAKAVEDATTTTAALAEIKEWAEQFLAVVSTDLGPDAETTQKAAATAQAAEEALGAVEAILAPIEALGVALSAQK